MMQRTGKVRPPKRPLVRSSGESDEFESCWNALRSACVDIHTQNASKLSFEQLYRASYKIVLRKNGELLYQKVNEFEKKWFSDQVIPAIWEGIPQNLINITLGNMPGTTANERRQMGEKFLSVIKDSWENHLLSMNMVADVLMYLDRGYAQDSRRPPIFASTIGLFRDHILRAPLGDTYPNMTVFTLFNAVILDLINMEREGDAIDRNLLRKCTKMLEDLHNTDEERQNEKLYLTVFEPVFLDASREFYRKECLRLVRDGNAIMWLRHTQRRLMEENDRCKTTISELTLEKIITVLEVALIEAHLQEFITLENSGIKYMIDNDRFEDLAILYRIIARVDPRKEALRSILQSRVVELGIEIEKVLSETDFSIPTIAATTAAGDDEEAANEGEKAKALTLSASAQQTAAAIKWVNDVLQLKDRFDILLRDCFYHDLVLQAALTKSFSEFINMFSRASEYVSLFIDDNLKGGIRGKTEAEVDVVLDKAITLIRYLQDKDMFERYFQKHLGRRLLGGKTESIDVEKQLISRMKQELGNNFTAKFEGMFKDMDISRDITEAYKEHIRGLGDLDRKQIDLGIHILTSNQWPQDIMGRSVKTNDKGQTVTCTFPPEIERLQNSFFKFYLKDRSGRKLTWLGSAGTAEIRCVFPKVAGKETGPLSRERRYDLTVSTYGMIILELFNDVPEGLSLSFEEIEARTNIPTGDLQRALATLSIPKKARVLLKDPLTKSVKAGDQFQFNASFFSKTIKIKAPTSSGTSKVEADEERKETENRNNQTRAHIIDASIVRIMKQRKVLSHNSLITEVVTQLGSRFKPEISMIKKQIESLLAREYMERTEEDQSVYRYLA